MATGPDGDLLTIAEVARGLKVSPVTIHRWLKQGRLTAYRVGPRAVRIARSDLARLMILRNGQGASQLPGLADLGIAEPTPQQVERRCSAIARARALRAEMRERRGGAALPSSWQLIRQAREQRGTRT